MQILANGDLTYFRASRAAKSLFPEMLGVRRQTCVVDVLKNRMELFPVNIGDPAELLKNI